MAGNAEFQFVNHCTCVDWFQEALQAIIAARAILVPVNTRLTKSEVDYILGHSGAKLILVDHEYTHFTKDSKVPVIVSKDTGRFGCPYEEFLSKGRQHSNEKGWPGLEMDVDENARTMLCYT